MTHLNRPHLNRRHVVKLGVLGALSFELAGCDVLMSPKEAKEKGARYKAFSDTEVATLERLGEILLPGASLAGIAHFIDAQVSGKPSDSLSILRYMDWPPPYANFYVAGLTALEAASQSKHGVTFAKLNDTSAEAMVQALFTGEIAWQAGGPPPPLFYFVLRGDAVDVVYGTMEGFEKLDVPYLAHIEPAKRW